MIDIVEANETHIPKIVEIAEKTWAATYTPILSPGQLRFMLDTLYSESALAKVMRENSQKFLLIYDENGFQGFASYGIQPEDPQTFKLHKIYILPENQGKGYGALMIDKVKKLLLNQGVKALDLNVNRNNPALHFYKKLGFKIIREEDIPIGQYWMNDYVMRLELQ
jgi:ribosomal protein S18 acetylase RimI-like enzyme